MPIMLCILWIEDWLLPIMPISSPCRQHSNDKSQPVRFVNNEIHMVPVIILNSFFDSWLLRILVKERQVSIGITCTDAIQLSNSNSLNHSESLLCPVLQIALRLLTIEPVKQFPRRIAQIEKGLPVLMRQESMVLRHFDLLKRHTIPCFQWLQARQQEATQQQFAFPSHSFRRFLRSTWNTGHKSTKK